MIFEVKVNGSRKIYKFKEKSLITVGRSESSDIQITANGISREHLLIHFNGIDYQIEDLGSTNGSFINEEKLTPKEKVPFNTFFPVKLGFDVYLSVMNDVDEHDFAGEIANERSDSSHGFSASVSSTSITQAKQRPTPSKTAAAELLNDYNSREKKKEKKKKHSMGPTLVFVFLFLGITSIYFLDIDLTEINLETVEKIVMGDGVDEPQVEELNEVVEVEDPATPSVSGFTDEELLDFVNLGLTSDKCLLEVESHFCNILQERYTLSLYTGAFYSLGRLLILISYDEFEKVKYLDEYDLDRLSDELGPRRVKPAFTNLEMPSIANLVWEFQTQPYASLLTGDRIKVVIFAAVTEVNGELETYSIRINPHDIPSYRVNYGEEIEQIKRFHYLYDTDILHLFLDRYYLHPR